MTLALGSCILAALYSSRKSIIPFYILDHNSLIIFFPARRGRVNVTGTAGLFVTSEYRFNGTRPVVRIEAIDQHANRTGGYVYRVDQGVLFNYGSVFFRSSTRGGPIHFIVNVYVEGAANDLVVGNLTASSVLIYEYV